MYRVEGSSRNLPVNGQTMYLTFQHNFNSILGHTKVEKRQRKMTTAANKTALVGYRSLSS